MLPNAVASELKRERSPETDPFTEIHKRLDQLSEKMDRCLAELTSVAAAPRPAPAPSYRPRLAIVPEPAALVANADAETRERKISLRPSTRTSPRVSGVSAVSIPLSTIGLTRQSTLSHLTSRTSRASVLRRESSALAQVVPFNEHGEPEVITRRELTRRLNSRLMKGKKSGGRRRANQMWAEPSDKSEVVAQWLTRRSRCDRLWEVLDDPHSSWLAWGISMSLRFLVVLSLGVTLLQTCQEESFLDAHVAAVLETAIDSVFLLECLLRSLSAPSKVTYFMDVYNWADILASFGLLFRLSVGFVVDTSGQADAVQSFLLFVLPVVRLLKLLRYFDSLRLLVDAAANSLEALPVLLYTMVLIVMASATVIYLVEIRADIPSLAHAIWLAIVTMTTVGYGDYAPKSFLGYIFVSVLTTVSVLFFALPVGIIGHEFTAAWQMRRQVLLFARVRKCFLKWGYGGEDVQALFEYADADRDGMLNLMEFCELLREMRLGLATESLVELFMLFDVKQEGFIEFSALLRRIFPEFEDEEAQEDDSELD